MCTRWRGLVPIVVALVAACSSGERGADGSGTSTRQPVAIGQPAPAYAAVTLDGHPVTLAGERGKVVLLNIWATWCHPCREEIPLLQSLYERHAGAGLDVVGVSVDAAGEQAKVRDFAKQIGMTYPLWHDPDQRVANTFLAVGVPASYLIGRDGTLLWRRIGVIHANDTTLAAAVEQALAASAPGADR